MHGDNRRCAIRCSMGVALRAELLKGRRAAARAIALIAPLPFCVIGALSSGVFGGGGAGGVGFGTYGWNFWYVLMLPLSVVLIASSLANMELRHHLRTVLGLPFRPCVVWRAKIAYAAVLTLLANLLIALVSGVCAHAGGTAPGFVSSLLTAFLVTVGCAWMVPVSLALTAAAGTLAGIAVPLLLQVGIGLACATSGIWWAIPMAATFRLPAAVIGVAPSGIPLLAGDPLGAIDGSWVASLAVAAACAGVLACVCTKWLDAREAR